MSHIFKHIRLINFRIARLATFDSTPKGQAFTLANGEFPFLCLPGDREISRSIFADGLFDFTKLQTAVGLLGNDFRLQTLVDVGANIGTICIPAVRRGLARRAIAIEPEPRNFRALMANIYLNDVADKIVCHNVAMGAENNQTLQFELSPDNSGDHRVRVKPDLDSDRELISVRSERLDSIITSADPTSCLIWMDTQGYEGFILKGATNILTSKIPMVIEFWPYGMEKAGSYCALKDTLLAYEKFFDLSEVDPKPVPMSESNLDNLCAKFVNTMGFTDILVVTSPPLD